MRIVWLLSTLALSTTAAAVPLELNHQGRLFDALGQPLSGSHDLEFSLFDATSGGSPLWTETHTVVVDEGYFSVQLGSAAAIDSTLFDGSILYLGTAVDSGAPLTDRLALVSVPYAVRAGSIDDGATIDASELRVGGTTIVAGDGSIDWSHLTGTPSYAADPHTHDYAATVHTHVAADLTSGTFDPARLPVGTGASQVAAGNHGHTAVDVGALPVAGGTLTGALQLGSTSDDTCGGTEAGTLRWDGTNLQACDGSGDWKSIRLVGAADGSSADNAATTCKTLHAAEPSLPSGAYWIDPDGTGGGSASFRAWCDMATDGGGWTLLLSYDHHDDLVPGSPNLMTYSWNTGTPDESSDYSRDWRVVPDSLFSNGSSEIMLKRVPTGSTMAFTITDWVGWDTTCTSWDSRCGYSNRMSMYAVVAHPSNPGYDYYFHACDGPDCHGTNTYEAVGVDCHADYTSNYGHSSSGGTGYAGSNQSNCPAGADPDLYGFGATSPSSNRYGSWGSINNIDLGRVAFYFRE